MTEADRIGPAQDQEGSIREQLERAVRDLWSMIHELGENHVVFMDRRRLRARVERGADGMYVISWEIPDEPDVQHAGTFQNPREAAFHAYQGPH